MITKKKSLYLVAASFFALTTALPAVASAQEADDDTVIVTGTRLSGVKAVDSAAPIVVLDSKALSKVGQTDLIQAMAQNTPSFTAQAFGGDTANLTLSAKLRGVSPNHALVLVDGKRRHTTGNLAVLGGAFQGAAGVDLSFLPTASIGRIEILQDGAAAQYGSDAVAGVINIITKKKGSGGSLDISGGQYMDGGGETGDVSFNIGVTPVEKAYLNFTVQSKWHDYSFRGDVDPRVASYPALVGSPDYPYLNKIAGDAQYRLTNGVLTAGYDYSDNLKFYSVLTYGKKYASAYENWRAPNRIKNADGSYVFPYGFLPREVLYEDDYQFNIGTEFKALGWDFDLSTVYGEDSIDIYTRDTYNASLFDDGLSNKYQTNFYDGTLKTTQSSTALTAKRAYEVGLATPLTVAGGLEYRNESYEIVPGEASSYYKTGAQSFPGYPAAAAGKHSRNNTSVYVDFAVNPVEKLSTDFALRFEDYSDFGNTTIGKLTGRYDFTDSFALRGTVSTGFRAPTLAEGYYTATNVGPTSAFIQIQPNSEAATLMGVNNLKAEKSKNLSFGMVAKPFDSKVILTLDAYYIKITDRIIGSGSVYAKRNGVVVDPDVLAVIAATGNELDADLLNTGVSVFLNGVDTETKGVDFIATTSTDLDKYGKIDWTLSANYNKTEVTDTATYDKFPTLLDEEAIANLETVAPKYKIVANGLWTYGKLQTNLKFTLYGKSEGKEQAYSDTWYDVKIDPTVITDLDFTYQLTDSVSISVGANNLFNIYPDEKPAALRKEYLDNGDNGYVTIYPTFSPFGINGGYYYSKLSVKF